MAAAPEMSAFERRSVLFLTLLYVFRMLGMFMVLPLLALYGEQYAGATPLLLGLALGVYGLSQAALQIPFGMCSDRWGRKPLIALGLLLFALGSVVAAYSDSIWGLIAGRALQGAGAIAGVIMALVGDVTAERNRSKAMASIGAAIGVGLCDLFDFRACISFVWRLEVVISNHCWASFARAAHSTVWPAHTACHEA